MISIDRFNTVTGSTSSNKFNNNNNNNNSSNYSGDCSNNNNPLSLSLSTIITKTITSVTPLSTKSIMRHQQKRDFNSNYGPLVINSKKDVKSESEEACAIRLRFPNKIPVIVDRYVREYELPYLNKRKFLVPQEITMSQFLAILKNRLKVGPTKALFLTVNNRSFVPLSKTLAEIYYEYRNQDGFLYITYSSQEVFG